MTDFAATFAALEARLSGSTPVLSLDARPDLSDRFAALASGLGQPTIGLDGTVQTGRRCLTGDGETPLKRHRARKKADRQRCVAILDTETDPFDNVLKTVVHPFLAVLYSDQFEPIIMWEDDKDKLIARILSEIAALPEPFTIYAHNGGKFDYQFFIHKLRGKVGFKGRGLMRAVIPGIDGIEHEIRDSMHIIPQALAGWKKDKFDYDKNLRKHRHRHRDDIIRYCVNDCKYLLQIVRKFIDRNGLKLSIGQAALSGLREEYKFECLGELMDAKLRGVHFDTREKDLYGKPTGKGYFYGGRVECFMGRGIFHGPLSLIDVNAMYPYVMANFKHPIGAHYTFRSGIPDAYTAFVRVQCRNRGALIARDASGATTGTIGEGEFFTTIWEFEAALDLGLIDHVRILQCVDCNAFSDFDRFVTPRYEFRLNAKAEMHAMHLKGITEKSNDPVYDDTKLTDTVMKFELTNAYGKFAQNPRRYSEHYFTDCEGEPDDNLDWGNAPRFKSEDQNYAIWERKAYRWDANEGRYIWDRPPRFYNVGTGASITGAARAVLLRASRKVTRPIYCDTDSIICADVGDLEINNTKLGAWKLEKTFDEVVIAGKKEYAAKVAGLPDGHKDRIVVKSKGVDGVTYAEMVEMAGGRKISKTLKGPTMDRYGRYDYLTREIGPTAPIIEGIDNGLNIFGTAQTLLRSSADT
jgi:hypothetical protein